MDYYKILELKENCTKEEIKKKFHSLSLKYHPDKSDFHDGYIKSINQIKDDYEPNVQETDETWTK